MLVTFGNPIALVDGAAIPCPSEYQYSLQDISASDAGRTQDGLMHKRRVGQKVKLALKWANVHSDVVSAVMTAFNPEYVTVKYFDAKEGDFLTKTFYTGDRATPLYNSSMGIWSELEFNIIEQ